VGARLVLLGAIVAVGLVFDLGAVGRPLPTVHGRSTRRGAASLAEVCTR
jgi:hypothetical protein